ncbi:MAG: glycerol-3-phosphate 1-O-acyltransferase PlsY [Candidatus Aureabacteria bacterium]|nr:glycerol-3-phosphate 1-O-acyltransferase PlsY [Candidatus Auribacterota bacterium]
MIIIRAMLLGVTAYLIGSIPTAYLMGRLVKGVDIRERGSGNVGATNVMRVLGTGPGLVTLAIDILKGFVVVRWAVPAFFAGDSRFALWQIFSCVAVIAGHNWMIFLKMKGGKGVATTAGAFLAMAPVASLSAIAVWGIVVAVTRYVSLGSIIAGVSLPIFIWLTGRPACFLWFSSLLTIALVLKHRANIQRLLAGTERKIGEREAL